MTDLEATRLCAVAMGFEWVSDWLVCPKGPEHDYSDTHGYDPLNDDETALKLVFPLTAAVSSLRETPESALDGVRAGKNQGAFISASFSRLPRLEPNSNWCASRRLNPK